MEKCPLCGSEYTKIPEQADGEKTYLDCPTCGKYIYPYSSVMLIDARFSSNNVKQYDLRKLTTYLFYNKQKDRYAFIGTESAFGEYRKKNPASQAFLVTPETVENWYPKTFADMVDLFLLWIAKKSTFMGEKIKIFVHQLHKLFFMKTPIPSGSAGEDKFIQELNYIGEFLQKEELIKTFDNISGYSFGKTVLFNNGLSLVLLNKGYNKIYELQKNQINNKKVFIAMSFSPKVENIHNAIASAVIKAECEVVSMKHRIHNKQIVPEILRLIRESKMLVMDISEPNFGAYYEAGYAQGLNKEVIITCKNSVMKKEKFPCKDNDDKECEFLKKYSKPHFDIAQKQILVWEDEADLTEQLTEWIKFLIG